MPWLETKAVNERTRFVVGVREQGLTVAEACRRFGVSRTTGYKWLRRYDRDGFAALEDQSRAPKTRPNETPPEVVERLLSVRREYGWGPKKIRGWLRLREPELKLPAASTVGDILAKHGLVEPRSKRRRAPSLSSEPLAHATAPNALWSTDFKGQFRLGNGRYCYPLTVTDNYSRFIVTCHGLDDTKAEGAKPAFERAFERYGVPEAIRSDNGAPFASTAPAGLTTLSVWWLKLGIRLERIEPGKPQQNGRHERMHLTLKRETTRPAGADMAEQQKRFEFFVERFNQERPHEALGQKPPATAYQPSTRTYDGKVSEPQYPNHDLVAEVRTNGCVSFAGDVVMVGKPLIGERVGLLELDDDCWLVSFCDVDLGFFRRGSRRLTTIEDRGRHWRTNRV